MGKAGKARKRQRLEREVEKRLPDSSESENDSEQDVEEHGHHDRNRISVRIFDGLSGRMDYYTTKKLKSFRAAVYPLVLAQMNNFFEQPAPQCPLSDDEMDALLCDRNLNSVIIMANELHKDMESFSGHEMKDYRRALHPLVLYHKAKNSDKIIVSQDKSRKNRAHLTFKEYEDSSVKPYSETVSNSFGSAVQHSNLTNRISYCFRIGDWPGALDGLREMARSPSEFPKLGELYINALICIPTIILYYVVLSIV